MNTNIRNAVAKMNAEFNYGLEMEISRTAFQPWFNAGATPTTDAWYVKLYNSAGMLSVEFIERDGGVVASVMDRFNMTTGKVTRIMDVLMEFMPITPPGGD
jgi:hypothetical protein